MKKCGKGGFFNGIASLELFELVDNEIKAKEKPWQKPMLKYNISVSWKHFLKVHHNSFFNPVLSFKGILSLKITDRKILGKNQT